MKRFLSLFLSLVMIFGVVLSLPLTVNAASIDDLKFKLNSDGKSYAVTECNQNASGKIVIPDKYKGLPVTKISKSAFYFCEKLTSIKFGQNIKSIGENSFSACYKIKSINIPESVTNIGKGAFSHCYTLTSATIPEGLTSVVENLFAHCYKLSSVTIPESVTSIGEKAFASCYALQTIKLPKNLKSIKLGAFSYCDNLSKITIPEGVERIEAGAFGSTNLTTIKIPGSVKSIGEIAFSNCSNLKTVSIGDNVTEIGDMAFFGCSKLTSVTIPKSVKSIGEDALGYNSSGEKIKGFTIRGVAGSAAEKYAKAKGFTFKKVSKPGTVKLGKATTTSTGVKITWSKVTGADKYTVYRKSGTGSYKAIKTVTGTSYTDSTAKSGTKYTYTVRAKNIAGLGSYDKTGLTKLYLKEPTLKSVSSGKSGVTVKWNKVTGAKGYYVYRKTGSGDWVKIATVKSGSTVSYLNKSAKKGTTYSYTVRAYNGKYISSRNTTGLKIKDKY